MNVFELLPRRYAADRDSNMRHDRPTCYDSNGYFGNFHIAHIGAQSRCNVISIAFRGDQHRRPIVVSVHLGSGTACSAKLLLCVTSESSSRLRSTSMPWLDCLTPSGRHPSAAVALYFSAGSRVELELQVHDAGLFAQVFA